MYTVIYIIYTLGIITKKTPHKSLPLCEGNAWVDSPHKWSVMWKALPAMTSSYTQAASMNLRQPCSPNINQTCGIWGGIQLKGSEKSLYTAIVQQNKVVNILRSLQPRDVIWRHNSGSTLFQVMACYLEAPSHYLNQYWLIIGEYLWHHLMTISQEMLKISNIEMSLKKYSFKITVASPRGQWDKGHDIINGCHVW